MKKQSWKNHKEKKLAYSLLQYKIRKLFKKDSTAEFDINKIKRKLNISNSKGQINDVLKKLLKEEYIVVSGYGKYIYNGLTKELKKKGVFDNNGENVFYTGIVDKTKTGSGYIIVKELSYDVYVPNRYMKTAMDGDKVKVKLLFSKRGSKNDGRIVEILQRAKSQFIGEYRNFGNYASVFVEGAKDEVEIFVLNKETGEIKSGDKVLIEISEWRGKKNPVPWGKILKSLGDEERNDIEMKSILINNGFKIEFPEEVIQEAKNLKKEITEDEIKKRRDFRDVLTVTIDPETAKDFDDALSLRELENGNIEVGIHIADVSHFVKPGTAIDQEAYEQSTSVYLVDRVDPMLPEVLSNELCSLRPHEESLTFSAVFEFDKDLKIKKRWFGKTIIFSDRRFTYEEVQEILESGKGDYDKELKKLNFIAKKLRKDRYANGSIDFNTEEVQFKLDEKGKPIGLFVKERKEAHMLVEDFMLLANKEVAKFIKNKGKNKEIPFVYRVHDLPDPDKLLDFAAFAKEFGIKLKLDTPQQVAKSFTYLSKKSEKDERLKVLIPLALRTMAKAIYTTDDIGHYGLGFEDYTHFTSPIRRYSDVLVHRILEKNLNDVYRMKKSELEDKCRHISEQERKAISAERESVKYKQVEYITDHIGEEFDGIITGFIEKGMFIELLDSKVEGMVEFNTLGQYFVLDDSKLKVTAKKSGEVMKIGDPVRVRIKDTDLVRRRVDFEMVPKNDNE
ncbi:MAG TPA: ribonuclease R [Bacteroidetes bacterium]|nr:ribonuclease R [Bacteroidota bacterium]